MLKPTILSLACCLVIDSVSTFAQCTGSGSNLVAPYASNSSNKGVMFNITATNSVTIHCFDANLPALSIGGYEIYYKVGSYVGSETNAANWTLLGAAGSILSIGLNVETPLTIPVNLILPAGQTYGFYITASNPILSTGLLTTTNAGFGAISTNGDVVISGGAGITYPFGTVTSNRSFNGTLRYSVNSVLPLSFKEFNASSMNQFALLEWETETESNTSFFEIERSVDGTNWEQLVVTNAFGHSTTPKKYQEVDYDPSEGVNYYRLSQTDKNGNRTELQTISWKRETDLDEGAINVFPNPGKEVVRVFADPVELKEIQVLNTVGQSVSENVAINHCKGYVEVHFGTAQPGVFIIKTKTLTKRLVVE